MNWLSGTEAPPGGEHHESEEMGSVAAFIRESDTALQMVGSFSGSNAWVLSPAKTKSGSVILVNDPHMAYSAPSVWYEAHLVTPDFELYGHHLAGIPFALLGHNRERAWGLTMFKNDAMDFYREKQNPEEPNQVWFKDHWEDLKVEKDVIHVKDAEDVVIRVRSSRHGPIINDVMRGIKSLKATPVSMWWAYHDFGNRALEGFYELSHATSLDEFQDGVSKIHSPGLNILYGDREGNIAWWAAARTPIRPVHVSSKFLLDGSTGKDEFLGFRDFTDNPHSVNPPDGILVSANNRPSINGQEDVAGYYNIDDRALRIRHLLESGTSFTTEEMKAMILDTVSPTALSVQEVVVPILESSEAIRSSAGNVSRAVQAFKEWRGNHDRDEMAPSLYHEFVYQMLLATFADELGNELFEIFLRTKELDWTIPFILEKPDSPWWDNVGTRNRREDREEIVRNAWLKALGALEENFGPNMEDWTWGSLHTLEHVHAIGRKKPFDRIFNLGPFSVAGGREVINKHSFVYSTGHKHVNSGPSTRRIIDFSDPEHSLGINPTGQSGYVFDRHYQDQADLYHNGELRTQLMQRHEITTDQQGILYLQPGTE